MTKRETTHPKVLQRGDRLGGVSGEQVVEQAEGAETGAHFGEHVITEPLDHIPLQVEGCQRLHAGQLARHHTLNVVLGHVQEGQAAQVAGGRRQGLEVAALHVEVFERLFETVERVLGHGEVVLRQL